MMSASMMRDRYSEYIYNEEVKQEDLNQCICGYDLRKEGDYINNQGQLVFIMVCDSCGAVEHWVENTSGLIESN